jgi:signal peptidase I
VEEQAAHIHSDNKHRPRRPWLAGVANLAPPLGHVYAGWPLRGIALALVMTFISIGALLLTLRPLGLTILVLWALILIIGYGVPMVDAVLVARRSGKEYRLKPYSRWYVYLVVFAIVVIVGETIKATLRSHIVQAYRIPAASMTPTLIVGDYILTDKTVYKSRSPKRFDLVIYEFPEDRKKVFVHRVVGLPGEMIEIRGKRVFINGTELAESHAYFPVTTRESVVIPDSFGPFHIPLHSYFVLGDNRNSSYDSRYWGPVGGDKVHGLVSIIYFSWDSEKSAVRWDRIGKLVE